MGVSTRRIRAVLFDMDGVLLDSFEAWLATVQDACRHFGTPVVDAKTFRSVFGAGTDTDVATFLQTATPREAERFYDEDFLRHQEKIMVACGARETLERLRVAGLKIGCMTNTVNPLAENLLRKHGIFPLLDALATPTEAIRPKPAPDMILVLTKKFYVRWEEALVVGDTRYDLQAARAARVLSAGFQIDGGDYRIERLDKVLDLVRESDEEG